LLLSCATLLILGWLARDRAEALCNDAGHDNAYLPNLTGIPDLDWLLSLGAATAVRLSGSPDYPEFWVILQDLKGDSGRIARLYAESMRVICSEVRLPRYLKKRHARVKVYNPIICAM
jgi:hypothetical protein